MQIEDVEHLTQIGLTKSQAKLYLTLVNIGRTDAKTLSKRVDIPRQAIYRTLEELLKKGIIEKIITLPQEYQAIPFREALAILLNEKTREYTRAVEKTREMLQKFDTSMEESEQEKEYTFTVVEGKERIVGKTRSAVDKAQKKVFICTTLPRWVTINQAIHDTVEEALDREVKFRAILEETTKDYCLPNELKSMIAHPNYKIKLSSIHLKSNSGLFDEKMVSFNFYPSKNVSDSPMIWTNHPSFLIGSRLYFEYLWKKSTNILTFVQQRFL